MNPLGLFSNLLHGTEGLVGGLANKVSNIVRPQSAPRPVAPAPKPQPQINLAAFANILNQQSKNAQMQRQMAANLNTQFGIGPQAKTPLPTPQAKQSNPIIGTIQALEANNPYLHQGPLPQNRAQAVAQLHNPNNPATKIALGLSQSGNDSGGAGKFIGGAKNIVQDVKQGAQAVANKAIQANQAIGQKGFISVSAPKIEKPFNPQLPQVTNLKIREAQNQIEALHKDIAVNQDSINYAKEHIASLNVPQPQKDKMIATFVNEANAKVAQSKQELAGWNDHIATLDPSGKSTPIKTNGETGVPQGQQTLLQRQAAADAPQPTTAQKIMGGLKTALGNERGSVNLNTPLDTKDYVNKMSRAQEIATKGDNGPQAKIERFYNEAKTKLVDSTAPIEDVFRAATNNGKNIPASQDIRYKIDNALRAPTMAGQFVKDSGLPKAIQSVPDVKTFDQYLIARHAQDLRVKGIETGRNGTADDKLVKQLAPQYEKQAKVVTAYSRKLLDYATQKGLVSKGLNKHLKAEYPNYVPVNRIFGENELQKPQGNGSGIASKSTQTVVQKIKGSARQIESPLQSLLAKTHDAFQQGEVNDAAKTLTSYKDLAGNPFSLRELKPTEAIGNKNTISVLDNGKKRVFETTPAIAAAAKSLNKEQLGLVGKILSVPTRVLRLGATGINLPFVASNVVKDSVTAAINSSNPLRTSVANPKVFLQSMAAAVGHGKQYQEMVRNGAGGTSMDIGRDAAKQSVQSIRAGKSVGSTIAYTVTHPGELLRAVENTVARSEEYGRAMQYLGTKQAATDKGASESEAQAIATQAARTNTTNFARGGDYSRVVNSVLPFFNAGIQGSRTLIRNLHDRPVQTAAKVAITTFMPVAASTAWNISDPQRKAAYDNIKDFEKQGNIIIVPPNPVQDPKTGKWNVIKIPLSQEIANLSDVVRSGVEAMGNDKGMNIAQIASNLLGTATSLNLNSGRDLVNQLTPQAIKPGVEALTNTNLFTGNTIVPQSLQNFPTGLQYKPTTSGTAVKIGQAIGVSPLQVENAIRTATGGVGVQVLNASDKALAALGAIPQSQVNGTNTLDSMAGRFNQAAGTSQAELDYQAKIQAAKDKNAGKIPKQLQGIIPGTAAQTSLDTSSGRDVLAASKTRVDKATAKLPPGISSASSATLKRYALLSASGKAKFNADPANKLKLNQAQYEENKLSGKLTGPADLKAQRSLTKQAVTSKYSQDVQDFYALSKANMNAYFKQDPAKAKQLYDQAKQLDSQLGGNKFKNGLAIYSGKSKNATKPKKAPTYRFALKQVHLPKTPTLKLAKAKKIKGFKLAGTKANKKITLTA